MIYLDNAATTKIAPEVLDAMMPYLQEQYGNAGTLYGFGRQAAEAIQTARAQTAMLFGCTPEHIVFTSGGSEGNNMIVKGLRHKLLQSGKTHLVLSATEHDSMIKAAESLTKDGFYITYVKPDPSGRITANEVSAAIQNDTGLVSIMMANNETGAVNDIEGIGEVCKRHAILFHSDCVQSAGQFVLDMDKNNLDFATISAHKIHGPKGVGAVYIRDMSLSPLVHGGAEQEFGFRGGTENVAGIVGLGAACVAATQSLSDAAIAVSTLKQMFVMELTKSLPHQSLKEAGICSNGYTYGKLSSIQAGEVSMHNSFYLCWSALPNDEIYPVWNQSASKVRSLKETFSSLRVQNIERLQQLVSEASGEQHDAIVYMVGMEFDPSEEAAVLYIVDHLKKMVNLTITIGDVVQNGVFQFISSEQYARHLANGGEENRYIESSIRDREQREVEAKAKAPPFNTIYIPDGGDLPKVMNDILWADAVVKSPNPTLKDGAKQAKDLAVGTYFDGSFSGLLMFLLTIAAIIGIISAIK